jgi:hypothetical protein
MHRARAAERAAAAVLGPGPLELHAQNPEERGVTVSRHVDLLAVDRQKHRRLSITAWNVFRAGERRDVITTRIRATLGHELRADR